MNMTGNELKELLEASPGECHRQLMKEYGRYVYAIVFNKLRSCGTREDIEECFCDVFTDIFLRFEYDEKYVSDIRGYIGTLAKRKAIDRFRTLSAADLHNAHADEEEMAELVSDISVDELVDGSELRRILLQKIKELGEPDSTILMQKFYYERSSAEIAKTVSMTASSVRSRITRAMGKLRIKLAEAGITR
jgi:RNA polymerase sigma-70 factor (ECF subfamily)